MGERWNRTTRKDSKTHRASPPVKFYNKERKTMLTGQALEIVLDMARDSYSKNFGPSQREAEAIEEVEFLLKGFEDTGNYTEEDYMED